MNKLPIERSALTGRTFSRSWNPADYDPITKTIPRGDRVVGVVLAVVIGIAGAALLVHWWAS